jgi:hypothetical protein
MKIKELFEAPGGPGPKKKEPKRIGQGPGGAGRKDAQDFVKQLEKDVYGKLYPEKAAKKPAKKAAKKEVPVGTFEPNPDAAKPDFTDKTATFPVVPTKKGRDAAKTLVQKAGGKQLGKGAFATAYNVPKDIESVVKISKLNREAWQGDGYYNYIKEIFNKQDNPYLPQIYEVLRMQPSNGDPYLMVNVEKLIHGYKLSEEEALHVAGRMFGDMNIEQKIRKANYLDKDEFLGAESIVNFIGYRLDEYARTKKSAPSIVDPQLKEALSIVYDLKYKGYTVDLHDENFMFRRTPYGMQLVLTDPLAFYYGNVKINTGKPPTKKAPRPKGVKDVDIGDDWD